MILENTEISETPDLFWGPSRFAAEALKNEVNVAMNLLGDMSEPHTNNIVWTIDHVGLSTKNVLSWYQVSKPTHSTGCYPSQPDYSPSTFHLVLLVSWKNPI